MKPGRFITLEGGEGTGKSTLAAELEAALVQRGISVERTREPGGTPGAEGIRKLLVEGAADRWQPMSEALLLYAARYDHVERRIKPALTAGKWVISDRFFDSTTAYQGAAGGIDRATLDPLRRLTLADFAPDLTLVLDLDPETGLRRAGSRGDNEQRFEGKGLTFHQRLRQGFLDIASAEPERCAVIDAGQPPADVLDAALGIIQQRLGWPQ
ncbi:thymidylate kinase [Glycocaulis alkaliphilus]|uniref:Thymidylate kinase n=1 Tax=Glycocaulis alkaliphilus TaxID=1434191 RepID=A0A3T0EAI2_9PROT|nr:dTMP kinase [Glycocaulis alkaliphilus]AZU04058.1 thymidylate kinase [Glycocaulis alkaliphilus]GGB75462.1 thymidylate kinase [Glycocaulis alkaliphilus]